MAELGAYGGLFLSAFVAATLLPTASEAVLVALLLTNTYSVWLLLLVATVGNVLGAVVNWLLGRGIERYRDRPWFPVKPESLGRAQHWYRRHGKWTLLLSWLPVVGDPLTVVAGVMRESFGVFLVLVTMAKFGRYLVLAGVVLGLQ
ncbi:MAG: YqaA family protein [Hydrogenophaga sp.]|uniref:YqaA family protein n=1 Tax=Hydrogenophaga sp. TaxID=1904254 RepID=UPI00272EEC95|nr:YqaA family protein [Hydrogenophaga sp.]MDP2016188.1 YqaA family protein [Hydrogenophaga sp.]MDZ4125726.1 YqaA family protein [Hydrogenophaga sp.]